MNLEFDFFHVELENKMAIDPMEFLISSTVISFSNMIYLGPLQTRLTAFSLKSSRRDRQLRISSTKLEMAASIIIGGDYTYQE